MAESREPIVSALWLVLAAFGAGILLGGSIVATIAAHYLRIAIEARDQVNANAKQLAGWSAEEMREAWAREPIEPDDLPLSPYYGAAFDFPQTVIIPKPERN